MCSIYVMTFHNFFFLGVRKNWQHIFLLSKNIILFLPYLLNVFTLLKTTWFHPRFLPDLEYLWQQQFTQWGHHIFTVTTWFFKVERILKGSFDSIPSPSPSVKIQIREGKVFLRCNGNTLLGVVNKLLITKCSPSNVLP